MDIKIIGEHIEITEAIENYIKNKFAHLPKLEKMQFAEFRLGKNGNNQQHVKFSANCNHKNITVDVSEDTAYHAIDQLMKKLHVTFTKFKESHSEHKI